MLLLIALTSSLTLSKELVRELDGRYSWFHIFGSETIQISGNSFTWDGFSDEIPDPNYRDYPLIGSVEFDEGNIYLIHEKFTDNRRVFRMVISENITYLVREERYEEFVRKGPKKHDLVFWKQQDH